MAWQTIWHDTDKMIERDDETGEERITWTNPAADGARLEATERTQEAIIDMLAESLGVEL